jgi:hypothetical protein
MLDKLLGKHIAIKRDPDKIWRSRDCEFKGLLAFVASLDRGTTRVLLIAHFADTLRALEKELATQQFNFRTYATVFEGHRLCSLSEYQSPESILLAHAQALPENLPVVSKSTASCGFEIYVLVAEHHPLADSDDHILGFAQCLPCQSRIGFYESLDGAFMCHYGGMMVSQLVDALQIPDNECISSPMVDRTIRQAQEKLFRQVANPVMTDTAEQWFQYNLPNKN